MQKRRQFLRAGCAVLGAASMADVSQKVYAKGPAGEKRKPQVTQDPALAGQLGIVTAILSRHMSVKPEPGKFTLLELPKVMRDELDLTVIDYNSVNFPNFDPAMLEKLRANTDEAGCVATNLKMNQKVDIGSTDNEKRDAIHLAVEPCLLLLTITDGLRGTIVKPYSINLSNRCIPILVG